MRSPKERGRGRGPCSEITNTPICRGEQQKADPARGVTGVVREGSKNLEKGKHIFQEGREVGYTYVCIFLSMLWP